MLLTLCLHKTDTDEYIIKLIKSNLKGGPILYLTELSKIGKGAKAKVILLLQFYLLGRIWARF